MTKIEKFRSELNNVFDDNLHTEQWHNIVDYLIIAFILISTLEVFLSTYDGLMERYGHWLHIVDYTTTAFFTVEVILRIWTADLLNPKYKGFWGRVRYCFSFYGMIDIISTFPFYLNLFMNIPYVALKAFRIARLLRIFRYMKAFSILSRAMSSKKQEMVVSLQFLTIVTLILSFVLFFVEHDAQPDVYNNGWTSVVWAFAQYIGDPGNFADTPPITFVGRTIAVIIGILGIAIFAVPAGLIGSGFSESLEDINHEQKVIENSILLKNAFERKYDRPTGYHIIPHYISLCDIQARLGLKTDDIFDVVESSQNFRLINLATTQPQDDRPQDKLAIEHFIINRSYGLCIDRGSKVTIVSPTSLIDPSIGAFSYYVALIGGFNYISRELGVLRPYKSYYAFDDINSEPNLKEYIDDLYKLTNGDDKWAITTLVASGALEPRYPTHLHFTIGGKKGDESYNGEKLLTDKIDIYDSWWKDLAKDVKENFDIESDHQRYHTVSKNNFYVKLKEFFPDYKCNGVVMRIDWKYVCWYSHRIKLASEIASSINRHLEGDIEKTISPDLKVKKCGYTEGI